MNLRSKSLHREAAKPAKKTFSFNSAYPVVPSPSPRLRGEIVSLFFLLLLGVSVVVQAASGDDLFGVVPAGDPTYLELKHLADAGWISNGDLAPALTRYDVTGLILKAEKKRDEIVVAQADMDIPPPP